MYFIEKERKKELLFSRLLSLQSVVVVYKYLATTERGE